MLLVGTLAQPFSSKLQELTSFECAPNSIAIIEQSKEDALISGCPGRTYLGLYGS